MCVEVMSGMWAPFKELVSIVNAAVQRKEQDVYYHLQAELTKHKPDFISLLKNPVRIALLLRFPYFLFLPPRLFPPPFLFLPSPPPPPVLYYCITAIPTPQARNDSHRARIQKAAKEGLELPNLPYIHSLPQDFVDEALVLSNILDLNEISAIELLLAGEQQLSR